MGDMALIKRVLAIGALGLLFTTAVAQERPATVTYSTVAKTADVVVAEIAQQTGLTLETTDDAKLHVLVLHVRDVPVEELLAKIASVTSSRWSKVGEKRVLRADAALRKREQAAVIAKNAEMIKKGIAELAEKLAKDPGDSPFSGAMFGGNLGSPAARALAQLSLLLDPKEIAQLAEDGRIVYSTKANRMQRSMSGSRVGNILNTLFDEHNAYAEKAIKDRQEMMASMDDDTAGMMGIMEMFLGNTQPRMFESAPSKALLVVETGGVLSFMSGAYTLKLKVYDQEGRAIATGEVPLASDSRFAEAVARMSEEEVETPQEVVDKTDLVQIEFSEKSKLYSKVSMMNMESSEGMSPELREFLLDPVKHDPLSFTNSDSLIAIAKAKKLNVVANLPDGGMMDAFMGGLDEPSTTVGQAMSMLEGSDDIELSNENGWLTVSPSDRISARDSRQDRAALRALVRVADRDGTVSLDTLAAFAIRSPKPMDNAMSTRYLGLFAASALQGMMGDTMDWVMLRFYGSLPTVTKNALKSGNQVAFSSIGGKARGYLNKMAFGSNANIMPAAALKTSADEPKFMQQMKMFMPGGDKSYTEEPTEIMPNGLPNNGFVVLNLTNTPIAIASQGAGPTAFGVGALGPEEVALIEFFQESAGPEMSGAMTEGLNELKMGSRENYRFTFWLSPEAGLIKNLQDDSVSKNARSVSLSNLPPAFRALVAKAKEQIKNSPIARIAGMMGGLGDQRVPPPQ